MNLNVNFLTIKFLIILEIERKYKRDKKPKPNLISYNIFSFNNSWINIRSEI